MTPKEVSQLITMRMIVTHATIIAILAATLVWLGTYVFTPRGMGDAMQAQINMNTAINARQTEALIEIKDELKELRRQPR